MGGQALADGFYVTPLSPRTKVLVWKSADAQSEANQLLNAGITDASLLSPLLACMVDNATKVIVTDMGLVTHDIMVISGPSKGCRGNIPAEELKSN